jgi:hypothetical protein
LLARSLNIALGVSANSTKDDHGTAFCNPNIGGAGRSHGGAVSVNGALNKVKICG